MKKLLNQQASCHRCSLWSGHPGNRIGDIMCAVNPLIKPEEAEVVKVDRRIAYAWHDCPHFERAIVPVLGGYSERHCTFEFVD